MDNRGPRVIAHRGASAQAPENTMAAMEKAADLGAAWVEFDVKLSRDGHPVVMHDDTLRRTCGAPGAVADLTLAELSAFRAGAWFGPAFADEPIPTLEGLVALLERRGLGANVELKPCPGRDTETGQVVGAFLRDRWPASLPVPVVSSFSDESLAACRAVAPDLPRALLVEAIPGDWADRMAALGCVDLHARWRELTAEQVRRVRGAGHALRCYTVNDPQAARRLFDWGVDAVISDAPDRMPNG
ncbi:MAG: glycerophosphodiester phosphodiesterase [Rhodobacterales bacterium]|nr:glycerophosphodiester phosphodiesterase [Rhodobacterales bacterium]